MTINDRKFSSLAGETDDPSRITKLEEAQEVGRSRDLHKTNSLGEAKATKKLEDRSKSVEEISSDPGTNRAFGCKRNDSGEGNIEYYELKDENMELVELNTHNIRGQSQHRELPVDVPESFVGVIKQTPRYPPPQPQQRTTIPLQPEDDKLKKYSDEVNRKKAEEEFLRSSLRGSKKLQQLEQRRKGQQDQHDDDLQPAINNAFEPDDEDDQSSEGKNSK